MKEEVFYVVDSLGVSHPETIERASVSLPQLFVEGGLGYMIIISLFLIALLLAAWKAPRWVKEIGLFALLFGILGTVLGVYQVLVAMRDFAAEQGSAATSIGSLLPPRVLLGGLKVTLNTTIYGICIYLVSLVVRVIQKPRL